MYTPEPTYAYKAQPGGGERPDAGEATPARRWRGGGKTRRRWRGGSAALAAPRRCAGRARCRVADVRVRRPTLVDDDDLASHLVFLARAGSGACVRTGVRGLVRPRKRAGREPAPVQLHQHDEHPKHPVPDESDKSSGSKRT